MLMFFLLESGSGDATLILEIQILYLNLTSEDIKNWTGPELRFSDQLVRTCPAPPPSRPT